MLLNVVFGKLDFGEKLIRSSCLHFGRNFEVNIERAA
jgi:hypothetical protein